MKNSESKSVLNFVSNEIPSLENLATLNVAISIWENTEYITEYINIFMDNHSHEFIDLFFGECLDECYQGLEKMIFEKLNDLPMPEFLKVKVSNYFRPVGLQILAAYLSDYFCNVIFKDGRHSLCWTMVGTVDENRLLEEIISQIEIEVAKKKQLQSRRKESKLKDQKCVEKDLILLYEIACKNCQEKLIPVLWHKLSNNARGIFSIDRNSFDYEDHIIAFWTAFRQNKLHHLIGIMQEGENDPLEIYHPYLSINENMVTLSVLTGNRNALTYFWYKLTDDMKIANIKEWIVLSMESLDKTYIYQFDSFFMYGGLFLLSHLSTQVEQNKFFQAYSEEILRSLFNHWPFQEFFIPTITLMIEYLKEEVYVSIILMIVEEIKERRTTEFFLNEVWSVSPVKLKMAFINTLKTDTKAIVRLLRVGDFSTARKILDYVTTADKKFIICRMIEGKEFSTLLHSSEFDIFSIDTFVSEVFSSDRDMLFVKRIVALEHAHALTISTARSGDFQAIEKLLKWAFQSFDEIYEFKQNHIFPMDICRYLIHLQDYEHRLDDFIKWYFEIDEDIVKFKKKFYQLSRKYYTKVYFRDSGRNYCLRN